MVGYGVTPMQGIDRGLSALADACWLSRKQKEWLSMQQDAKFRFIPSPPIPGKAITLDEYQSKTQLSHSSIPIPRGVLINQDRELPPQLIDFSFPVALKVVSAALPHKTEVGGVTLGLNNAHEVQRAMDAMKSRLKDITPGHDRFDFLVEEMVGDVVCELLVGIKRDPQFGPTMLIASGGIFVELIRDGKTLLLPSTKARIAHTLTQLPCYPLIKGFRGRPGGALNTLIETIYQITQFAEANADTLLEMDINPLMVTQTHVYAADALIRLIRPA